MTEIGEEEGQTCNRNGCYGTMIVEIVGCSCHISPPCNACLDGLVCDTCGSRMSDDGHDD